MGDQETAFSSAYGEAMFYAHLIEDVVALHISECSYYHVNGYSGLTRIGIRKLDHAKRIDELAKIYHGKNAGGIGPLIASLHLLRKIRNKLTHAFFPEVGSDFGKEEGTDQIIAMLRNISKCERRYFKTLQKLHESVCQAAVKHCLDAVIQREDPPFDARVARSKIQKHLEELKTHLKG